MNVPQPFNLVDRPWITVTSASGVEDVSLRDAFRRAPEITQIVGEVPTQTFAILRLLLAILHRASDGPQSLDQWVHMRDRWPDAVAWVDAYLTRFHERFDVRHPREPFFQVAELHAASDGVSGLEKLIADVPNGQPFQTTRLGSGLERISWAEAARWLVHVHAYDPAGIRSGAVGDPRVKNGKGYPNGVGWAGQIGGVHVVGRNLAETFLLNLVVPDNVDVATGPKDLPPWERPHLTQCADDSNGGEPRGLVDAYTWQARRVRLTGDDDGVTGLVLSQGDRMTPQNRMGIEALTGWRYSEPQTKKFKHLTYMPREHDPERALWRGLKGLISQGPAVTVGGVARTLRPAVVNWTAELESAGHVIGPVVSLRAVGFAYGSNQSTYDELIDDVVVIPAELLANPVLGQIAVDAVDTAERAVLELAALARNLALAAGAADLAEGKRDQARATAYARLDGPFRGWLTGLGADADLRSAATSWEERVLTVLREIGRDLVEGAGTAAWRGRSVKGRHLDIGLAESWFRAGLAKTLPLAHHPGTDTTAVAHQEEGA